MNKLIVSVFMLIAVLCGSMICTAADNLPINPFGKTELQRIAGDYDVDTGQQGTYHSGGVAPSKKCESQCNSTFHECSADCFRGDIRLMGGCLGECRAKYCTVVCP